MKKVVFTGGPSAGKTSLIKKLKDLHHEDSGIFFAPEVASMLLGNDFPRCTQQKNLIYQQKAIFQTQLQMESLLEKEMTYKVCFFDRGLLDALAYIEEKSLIAASQKDLIKNYDLVLHLEVAPEVKYTKQNNKARTESYREAKKLEAELSSLWSKHSNYQFVRSHQSFDEKFSEVYTKHIQPLLN